jgi:hypothetical protein
VHELRSALVRLTVGQQPTEELPDLAARALAKGIDVPALRELAGLSRIDVREARDLFLLAMEQLGANVPVSRWDAVRFWAAEIVNGALTPYEGARLIWFHGYLELDCPDELTAFVGLASEWEDDPTHRALYEQDILNEARQLLAQSA